MLAKELAYYRAHFRDAVQEDGVICLECGAIFKYLRGHLCKHNLSSHEYKAKWGYNRTTPLERLSTRRKKRRNALAMNWGHLAHGGRLKRRSMLNGVVLGLTVQRADLFRPKLQELGLLPIFNGQSKEPEPLRSRVEYAESRSQTMA